MLKAPHHSGQRGLTTIWTTIAMLASSNTDGSSSLAKVLPYPSSSSSASASSVKVPAATTSTTLQTSKVVKLLFFAIVCSWPLINAVKAVASPSQASSSSSSSSPMLSSSAVTKPSSTSFSS